MSGCRVVGIKYRIGELRLGWEGTEGKGEGGAV